MDKIITEIIEYKGTAILLFEIIDSQDGSKCYAFKTYCYSSTQDIKTRKETLEVAKEGIDERLYRKYKFEIKEK